MRRKDSTFFNIEEFAFISETLQLQATWSRYLVRDPNWGVLMKARADLPLSLAKDFDTADAA